MHEELHEHRLRNNKSVDFTMRKRYMCNISCDKDTIGTLSPHARITVHLVQQIDHRDVSLGQASVVRVVCEPFESSGIFGDLLQRRNASHRLSVSRREIFRENQSQTCSTHAHS